MSNTVKQLGFIPTNRGEYDTTGQTRYYKDNVVQYRNGSYICTPVGYSSSNPTAYTTDAPYQDGDTELNANWKLMASVGLVDEEPVAGSENLVKSGGIFNSINPIKNAFDHAFIRGDEIIPTGVIENNFINKVTANLVQYNGFNVKYYAVTPGQIFVCNLFSNSASSTSVASLCFYNSNDFSGQTKVFIARYNVSFPYIA